MIKTYFIGVLSKETGTHLSSLFAHRSAEQCSVIFDLCKGRDRSVVVDDQGGLQKTLSVENSFKRSSVTTKETTLAAIEELYYRLPRLLKHRTEWSTEKEKSFPTCIRLTVRSVDPEQNGNKNQRRPVSTKSKQTYIDGQVLLKNVDAVEKQASVLRQAIRPLLNSLVFAASQGCINITRINVALTGFQDVAAPSPTKRIANTVSSQNQHQSATRTKISSPAWTVQTATSTIRQPHSGVHVDVLNALPPDIAAEVRSGLHLGPQRTSFQKRTRIDQFFTSRKKSK